MSSFSPKSRPSVRSAPVAVCRSPVVGRVSIRLERVRTRANGAREPIETRYFLQSITSRHVTSRGMSVGRGMSVRLTRVRCGPLSVCASRGRSPVATLRRRSTLDARRGPRTSTRRTRGRGEAKEANANDGRDDERPRASSARERVVDGFERDVDTSSDGTSTETERARERETRSDRVETREGDRESKYHREVSTASERDIAHGGAGRARARGRSRWRGRARDDAGAADDDERLQS